MQIMTQLQNLPQQVLNNRKTDTTNNLDNQEDVVNSMHKALRAAADCLADWLNNPH